MASGQVDKVIEAKPWERQRDENGELEPNLWFDRFTDYRLMGATRSLLGCVNRERVTKSHKESNFTPGSWRDAFRKWSWDKRAEAWDEHLRQENEAEWEQRRAELRAWEWETARAAGKRCEQMLKFPLQQVTKTEHQTKDGKTIISHVTVEPVDWKFSDMTRLAEVASKLARLAAEMETESKKLDLTSKGKRIGPIIFLPVVDSGDNNDGQ